MGITPSVEKEDVSLDRAVSLGAERCVYILKIMVAGLADILAGAEAGVAGPIGVARMAGTVADSGMTALFAFYRASEFESGLFKFAADSAS